VSRRPVTDRPRHMALLHSLGSGKPLDPQSTTPTVTFHLLTEATDTLITEAGDFLDIEHV
jgi:hypothetical protein